MVFLRFVSLIVYIALITACSSKPKLPDTAEQAEKLAAVMENGGYVPSLNLAINSSREVWAHDGKELEVVMTVPVEPGSYPLIIYLPSLGESASAGRLWREIWAKAGYAVFSIQPLTIGQALKELSPERGARATDDSQSELGDDEDDNDAKDDEKTDKNAKADGNTKTSRSARSSELRYLGHEYFAVDVLKNRMQELFWFYRQLKLRAGSGDAVCTKADFSRFVLAGYDLGAQTVTAVLGENFGADLPVSSEFNPLAAIVMSPSIDLAEGNVRSRFQKVKLPMLVITGSEDNDPYAISSASVRAAVWEFSPPGEKYLLLLSGGVHQLLAGADMGGRFALSGKNRGHVAGRQGGGSNNRFAQFANQYGGGGSRHGGGKDGPANSSGNDDNEEKNSGLGYKQVAAVYSASTAFLDVIFKNDEFAQFWLEDKANKWLDRAGQLKIR